MKNQHLSLLKNIMGDDVKIVSSLSGGMMNESYIVSSKICTSVFYVPTEQANEMVDRSLEKKTQSIAEAIGITRKTLFFDENSGIKLLKFIEGDSLNHISNFDAKKVANLFFKFHSAKESINVDYLPFKKLDLYINEAKTFVKEFDNTFYKIFDVVFSHKNELESYPKALCHNDGQRSNIIKDKNDNYWLIDYEFSMNNDPIYDIATFGNDNVNDGIEVLNEYTKLTNVENAFERYCLWRMFISLQWYLVALIKHYRGEGKVHGIDFLSIAKHFLENAKQAKEIFDNK